MKGHIYFIMGQSGSGKGTVISKLQESNIPHLHIPLSYKTRAIRETEVNHVDSHFITKEAFVHAIEQGEFLEYAYVYEGDDIYGTKYEDVIENGIEKGYTVIKELDIQGLEKLRREKPELDSIYTTIFLSIPAEKLKERIESRGVLMQNEEFERRKQTAIEEQKKAQELCDVMIDATQPPDEVFTQVCDIITKTK